MSASQPQDGRSEDYDEKAQELIKKARETKQELDAKQNEALEEIAAGESLERYETVALGELELEVLGWLPGSVEDTVMRAGELAESGNPENLKESKETMIGALAEMTTSDDYDKSFWREFTSRYGQEGLIMAVETVLGPAQESMEERKEGVESFRGE